MTNAEIKAKAIQFIDANQKGALAKGFDEAKLDTVIAEGLKGDERDIMIGSTMRMHVIFANMVAGELLRDGQWLPQEIPADKMRLAVGNTIAAKAAHSAIYRNTVHVGA